MSKFVVSARKYRPTTFEDVIGQDHISHTLKNALLTDQLAHAFLFCGPRGVGKTTCARILAKVINCQNPKDKVEPCNVCSSCVSFNENASFNIFELDAASNNSVDHIRALVDQVRFQPQQGAYKVFIIDEVHMLSTSAFNAFLKTLEEPPSYAIFILATTEKHKIIPTILSRCQIFDFKRIQPADIVKQLELICNQEEKIAEPEALHQIALKADGAMRDALSIFDKISSSVEADTITYKDVIVNLNILDYDYFFKAMDAVLRSDLSDMMLILDEVIQNGFDAEQFIFGLSGHLRELLVGKDAKTIGLMECSDVLKKRYYDQSLLCPEDLLLSALNILNQCDINLPRANNKRLHTEIALSKICYVKNIVETDVFNALKVANKKVIMPSITADFGEPTPVSSVTIKPKSNEAAPTYIPPRSNQENDNQSNIVNHSNVERVNTPEPSVGKSADPIQKTSIKNTPTLKGIDEIKRKLQKEEEEKRKSTVQFTDDLVKQVWKEYGETAQSMSVKSAMNNSIVSLEGIKTILVHVPNGITRDLILQESLLIEKLRTLYADGGLIIEVVIDKTKFPDIEDQPLVKSLNSREIFEAMSEKNQSIRKLVEKLKLKSIDSSKY